MATSLEFTAGPSDLWPVSWLHLGGGPVHWILESLKPQVCSSFDDVVSWVNLSPSMKMKA